MLHTVGIGRGCFAFYDIVSTFPPNCFLNDGVSQPKIVGMSIFFRKMTLLYTWAM